MDPVHALETLGGVSSMRELVAATSRRRVRTALGSGLIERAGRRLVLPSLDAHARAAADLTGVRSHLSAAQAWGWKVKTPPDRAWVIVGRHRSLTPLQRRRHNVTYVREVLAELARRLEGRGHLDGHRHGDAAAARLA